MYPETDLHKKKVIFIQLLKSPIPPLNDHLQEAAPLDDYLPRQKGHEKCIFETLHNEMKCVLSIKEPNFNEKMGQNFHICLWSGPTGLTPHPPLPSA